MKFELYSKLYQEALAYDDVEMYISERGWQEWMDVYGEDHADRIADILTVIYTLAHSTVKDMREAHGLSRAEFCRRYFTKVRTVENWDAGVRNVLDSEKMLIAYTFFVEDTQGHA